MLQIKCLNCGHTFKIDEKIEKQKECPYCKELYYLDPEDRARNMDPAAYQKLKDKETAYFAGLDRLKDEYRKQSDSTQLLSVLSSAFTDHWYTMEFSSLYWTFIKEMVGIALEKKDEATLNKLIADIWDYDDFCEATKRTPQEGPLLDTIVATYPNEVVNEAHEWLEIVRRKKGNAANFSRFLNPLINFITEKQDKTLAIGVFYELAKKDGVKESGEAYLNALFMSKKVASDVFPVGKFDAGARIFVRRVFKYCGSALAATIKTSDLYQNYIAARHKAKRRNGIVAGIACAVAVILAISVGIWGNSVKKDSVEFHISKVLEVTYSEQLDLSEYSISFENNWNEEKTVPITASMLEGYDPEKVGTQTVTLRYGGQTTTVTVQVLPAMLSTPAVTAEGNNVTWISVPFAAGYKVYVNGAEVQKDAFPADQISFDLSNSEEYGEIRVTVRAIAATASDPGIEPDSDSLKYRDSAISEAVTLIKLKAPDNIEYKDGVLTWAAVTGAKQYEVTVNGTQKMTETPSCSVSLIRGENEIKIVAKGEKDVVDGKTETTFSYSRIEPVTTLVYREGKITWSGYGSDASMFAIKVDDVLWKDSALNSFNVQDFLAKHEAGVHKITITCSNSTASIEPSAEAHFYVCIGNVIRREGDSLVWDEVGTDAVYLVQVGTTVPLSIDRPTIALSELAPRLVAGENEIFVSARTGNAPIICESVVLNKLSGPEIGVLGGNWAFKDGDNWVSACNPQDRFLLDGGNWENSLPALSTLSAGAHTIRAKKLAQDDFEMDSEEVTLHVYMPAVPVIAVRNGEIVCENPGTNLVLELYQSSTSGTTGTKIQSLADIKTAGLYYIRAKFVMADDATGYDLIVDSGFSEPVTVTKLEAPHIYYDGGDRVTTDSEGTVKFYYMYEETEHELSGGIVANLPKGVFEIYGRRIAAAEGELTSENTPASLRVSVLNLNIKLHINRVNATSNELYASFEGCEDMDALSFTYTINYYNAEGTLIGSKAVPSPVNAQATGNGGFIKSINFMSGIVFEQGYSEADIDKVELVVTLTSGTTEQSAVGQHLTAEMNI